MFQMIFIAAAALLIHSFRVPVALARNSLWSPVRPDAEFCITEPFRVLVLGQRFVRRLIWSLLQSEAFLSDQSASMKKSEL